MAERTRQKCVGRHGGWTLTLLQEEEEQQQEVAAAAAAAPAHHPATHLARPTIVVTVRR